MTLHLGHRVSLDFHFSSNEAFDPDRLAASVMYLRDAERVQVAENTLTCRVDRDGAVLVSFFGGLGLGRVSERLEAEDTGLRVASLIDIAGMKMVAVQKRAEVKDYLDVDAVLRHGVALDDALAAGKVIYGRRFNPLISLKALAFFGDLPALPDEVKKRLSAAVAGVDLGRL